MYEGHADDQRDHAREHDLVFSEEHVIPDESAAESHEDDNRREDGTPPTAVMSVKHSLILPVPSVTKPDSP